MAPRKQPTDRKKAQSATAKRVRKEAAKRPAQRAAAQMKAAQQPDKPVSTADQWKKSSSGYDLEVPSGNVARVRRPGMRVFLDSGIVPNSLMEIIRKKMDTGEELTKDDLKDLTPEQMLDMVQIYDNVCVYCVVEPKVEPVPENGERADDKLYVDEVDLEDKMFIFQWAVGGTRDLESFRKQQDESFQRLSSG